MAKMKEVKISGIGAFYPEKVYTNKDLEQMVDTTDEWIRTRTGISERRIAAKDDAASDIGFKAAQKALEQAGVVAEEIDLVITATITPDYIYPATSVIIIEKLGAKKAFGFDIEAACSGFIYGISIAKQYVRSGRCKKVLVVAAEILSRITDWDDRNTCVLFGDGSGAAVIEEADDDDDSRIMSDFLGGDGQYDKLLMLPAGGSLNPASEYTIKNRMHYMKMEGREVFKAAVNAMVMSAEKSLEMAGVKIDEVDLLIPHQANIRIISSVGKSLGIESEKVYTNLEKYGNTSGASIGLALNEAIEEGRIKKGSTVLLVAFGGGFTWGALTFRL